MGFVKRADHLVERTHYHRVPKVIRLDHGSVGFPCGREDVGVAHVALVDICNLSTAYSAVTQPVPRTPRPSTLVDLNTYNNIPYLSQPGRITSLETGKAPPMANLRTPLFDWHVAHKARMVPFGGWDMPVQYTSVIDEHKAVRSGAGLFDVSHMGRLSFGGTGAMDLIQKVWTNNAATMKEMQVRYGLICNEDGGTLDDVLVYRWPYGWAMVVNASNRDKIVAWLKEHTGSLDVQMQDQTLDTACSRCRARRRLNCVPACSRPIRARLSTISRCRLATRERIVSSRARDIRAKMAWRS